MAEKIKEKNAPKSANATTKVVETVAKPAKPQLYEVLQPFRNSETKKMQEVGDEITVANENRLKSMFKKGLLLDPNAAPADSDNTDGDTPPADDSGNDDTPPAE